MKIYKAEFESILEEELSERDKSLGACPICGKKKWWFNDVPLAGFCWGTKENPHKQVKIVLKGKHQPYKVE